MLNDPSIKPVPIAFGNLHPERDDTDIRRENTSGRIEAAGPGTELLRRVQVAQLRVHLESFYEHGSVADIFALCATFDLLARGWCEPPNCSREQASFVECFLGILGLSPDMLLKSGLQKRPDWPL